MIKIGDFNNLEVKRQAAFGYFLDGLTNKSSDDILLHNNCIPKGVDVNIGDKLDVFIFKDSEDRLAATISKPYFTVDNISYLKVVAHTKIGSFIDVGLSKDILVPFKARHFDLDKGSKYLFYIYLDKSSRLAATTDIDIYLSTESDYHVGDEVTGIVYDFQTNNSAMVCVDNKYAGVILHNEYFTELKYGDELKLKVIKLYEDGRLGLTPRFDRKSELDSLEETILSYMHGNDGFMRFNDKSDPEDIKTVFNSSKKNFKRTLGVLMKKGMLYQNEEGTYLT